MKWIGISGSWRTTSQEIERDVRRVTRDIILAGNGIITGGALNIDYFATDEVLKLHRPKQIKVFLPTTLSLYAAHYRKRADEKVITRDQAERLIAQLETFQKRNPDGIIVNSNNPIVDQMAYYERNQAIIDASDELIAFQINKSKGTQDTIDKAKTKGIPVIIHSYSL